MKLRFIIICDNAFTDESGRLNIVQAFDIIKAPGFPAIHPRLSIVTRWDFENEGEKKRSHKQGLVIFEKATGKELVKIPERPLTPKPGQDTSLQFINNISGLKFDSAGTYQIQVNLDDKQEEVSLEVKKEPN